MKILKNVVAILLLSWFGITCFKMGWYSRDNPFIRPLAASVLGLDSEDNRPDRNWWKQMQRIFDNEDNQ